MITRRTIKLAVLRESLIKLSGNNDVDEIPAESLTADEEMNGHCDLW